MLTFKIVSYFLVISFIFSLYLVNFNIYAQVQVETAVSNAATSEAVTSVNDAILKSLIIISQVAVLGIIFNYFFLSKFLSKKRGNILSKQDNVYFHTRILNLKRVTSVVIICCVSIVVFSTGSLLLQSYQLSQNLEIDILSAFDILDTTSVGQVWIFRIVTSSALIGVMLTLYIIYRKKKKANRIESENLDKEAANKISFISNMSNQILLLIVIALSAINLFSNSMVSHSNSLSSFPTIAVTVDWVHFMAVSIWLGGLFYLSLVVVKNLKPVDDLDDKPNSTNTISNISDRVVSVHYISIALMYFSFIVIIALCIIGISGLYLGYVHLQDLGSVFDTTYGQLLVLKLALAFPLIFIGRYNQIKIYKYTSITSNSLKDLDKKNNNNLIQQYHKKRTLLFKTLNRSLKIESILGIIVLIVASFLSVTSPPSLEIMSQYSFTVHHHNTNIPEPNDLFLFYLVIALAVIISVIGIVNFRRNQKQIKTVFAITDSNC